MCAACGEDHGDPPCYYCGKTDCFGLDCEDPDVCRTCWIYENAPPEWSESYGEDDDPFDYCMENHCQCRCHAESFEDAGVRFEAGVRFDEALDGPPYVRKGIFPFLKLPGEIRDKIYGFAFLQDGKQRQRPSAKHRGSIHTNLLRTCRQVYREAGTLPLTLNQQSFTSPVYALEFFGFLLTPTLRHLVTDLHIEYHFMEFGSQAWEPLMRKLAQSPTTHFGLKIKGGQVKEGLLDHTCWMGRFDLLKQLKTVDLTITSGLIVEKDKKKIVEQFKERLIKDYVRPKEVKKSKSKRTATGDGDSQSEQPTKKAKKVFPVIISLFSMPNPTSAKQLTRPQTKHQAKIVTFKFPALKGREIKSSKPERLAAEAAAKAAIDQARQSLLTQYAQIKDYATSLDFDAAPVRFRLNDARIAAEAVNKPKFELLARGILLTLDEKFQKIISARQNILAGSGVNGLLEPKSSQESATSSNTQISDVSMEL